MPAGALGSPILVPSRREQRKNLTRSELLLAGRKLFSEKGLYLSRIEDLASTAGIAKGTLYLYFKDRDALILAVVEGGFRQLRELLAARLEGADSATDIVRRLALGHLEFYEANRDLLRIFHQVRGLLKFHGDQWKPLRDTLEGHVRFLEQALAAAPGPTGMSVPERLSLAKLLFGMVAGVASVEVSLEPEVSLVQDTGPLVECLADLAARRVRRPARRAAQTICAPAKRVRVRKPEAAKGR